MTCSLVCSPPLFISLFDLHVIQVVSGCVSFIIMLIGLVKIILLDSQLEINPWRLVISSSIGEGVEDVRCLNWFCFWVITAHFLTNQWMAWKANVWLNNSRHKPTYYMCCEPGNWILSRCKCVIQEDFVLNMKIWSLVLHFHSITTIQCIFKENNFQFQPEFFVQMNFLKETSVHH